MSNQPQLPLAAVRYGKGESTRADTLLTHVAKRLRENGYLLAGAVQHNQTRPGRCRCDMTLEDLGSGSLIGISQDRGREARGCNLDHGELETLAGMCQSSLRTATDLVIINRFGKLEASGHGFRDVIAEAVASNTPCIVGLGEDNVAAWHEFTGGLGSVLEPREDAVLSWCYDVLDATPTDEAQSRTAPAELLVCA